MGVLDHSVQEVKNKIEFGKFRSMLFTLRRTHQGFHSHLHREVFRKTYLGLDNEICGESQSVILSIFSFLLDILWS